MRTQTIRSRKNGQVKQARLEIVAKLYKRGYSYRQIQREVIAALGLETYAVSTVGKDVLTLLDEWRSERIKDVDAVLQLELQRIDDACIELWAQWEKSKEDYTKTARKYSGVPGQANDDGMKIHTVKADRTEEEVARLGNPAYITEIRQQLAERRKLLGLYAATKAEVTGANGSPLFAASDEDIQAEIERIRASRGA